MPRTGTRSHPFDALPWQGQPLDWTLDPIDALRRWPRDRAVMILHSGRHHPRWARWSLLTEPTGFYRFANDSPGGNTGTGRMLGELPSQLRRIGSRDPFSDLRQLLHHRNALWIGCLSYDLGRWIEELPAQARNDRHWPAIELGYCPGFLIHDARAGTWQACGSWEHGGYPALPGLESPPATPLRADAPQSVFSPQDYQAMVQRVIDYIAAGDVFQVNVAQRFTASTHGEFPASNRHLFSRLSEISPAWYGAYLELSHDSTHAHARRAIASTSPELFLEVTGDRVITRPIKGTRPAHIDPAELQRSPKDTAELNMIVDLLRNDLGRVCRFGSVRVEQPRAVESHPTVHHGVATITGRLREDADLTDLLRATMPGGSITGAPKVRAMQIIDELERVRRGPYCGAIGVLSPDFAVLNIAIRTMLLEQERSSGSGRVDFSVGGGIVADSVPVQEYQETLDKAQAILKTLGFS